MNVASWIAIVGPITTLLGGLGGYWLAGRNEEARDRRAGDREAAARRDALAERLEEERHTFQRDTLLELQDQLQLLARVTSEIAFQDKKALTEKGQLSQLPDELSEESRQIITNVQRLRTRVLDLGLRGEVADFIAACTRVGMPRRDEPAESMRARIEREDNQVTAKYIELNALLGNRLREELDRRSLAEFPRREDQ